MPHMAGHVLDNFRFQAEACQALGSPFTATLCNLLADRLDDSSRFGARILSWPETAGADALALRAAGALHALARSGRARELAALYPPLETQPEALWEAIARAIDKHDDVLHDFLDSPPQTNEIRRSSALLGMALWIAQHTGKKLELLEIGASAGLNLTFDRHYYVLGETLEWGDPDALVRIDSEWRGNAPDVETELDVVSRAGCDRNPLDPSLPESLERLLAYIWADQQARLERTTAALTAAASSTFRVDKADAADWLEAKLSQPQEGGVARVVFHTIVWQYLSQKAKARITQALEQAGAAATADAPLAWMRMEPGDEPVGATLSITLWPGGETRQVGVSDYHGRWVEWAEEPA